MEVSVGMEKWIRPDGPARKKEMGWNNVFSL